jgi:flagellar hook assembly protein FlgD
VIAVYDASGRRIRTLIDGRLDAGRHTVLWDGTDDRGRRVATGIYFCRLESTDSTNTLKLALVK